LFVNAPLKKKMSQRRTLDIRGGRERNKEKD
jgi:hypothetical protein